MKKRSRINENLSLLRKKKSTPRRLGMIMKKICEIGRCKMLKPLDELLEDLKNVRLQAEVFSELFKPLSRRIEEVENVQIKKFRENNGS